ncbi:VOC family protein, partial [Streptomyces sp. NPDC058247]|uniref:VOC family protein n=1 Tax=Streptomyces sp. NPDC058247 TaxID=3346401 RepID=UPI0036E1C97A
MSTTFFGASFDAADAARAAAFWAAVLDREVADGADAHDAVVEAGGPAGRPRQAFHQVPEAQHTKNPFHPHLINRDDEGESQRLL